MEKLFRPKLIDTLKTYSRKQFTNDLFAGIIVGVVALPLAIAFAIAAPVAVYFMHQWLQDYVYRISLGWWIFLIGGLTSVIIALTTVSFQAIKAAIANPVKSLRTE